MRKDKYDLIVAGGGFSGAAAALAAAREGLSVLLVEQGNCLGGAAANCLVNPFMPFWTGVPDKSGVAASDGGEGAGAGAGGGRERNRLYLSAGIFREILDGLRQAGALDVNGMTFDEEYLKLLLNRMIARAGVTPLFHTLLAGAESSGGAVGGVDVANKSGCSRLYADYYIDATGDGDLAAMCGFPFRLGRERDGLCQPMTLCFRMANVDLEAFQRSRHLINPLYKELRAQGKIKNIREDVLIFPTLVDGALHFNSTRIVRKNPVDAYDVTQAEMEAREQAYELHAFLRDRIDGFQNSKIIMTAPSIGVRESRKIIGEYTLTADDLKACVKFDDAVATGNYDIDIHNPEGSGTSHYYFAEGEYYTIPYRSLIPKGSVNLLTAGRCISATHEAQASIRIIPIACCTGEAAGVATAVAHRQAQTTSAEKAGVANASIAEIQAILRARGAFIM